MEKYRHYRTFEVEYNDVDFKDELKPSTALAYFEEGASSSAEELGFGYSFVKPRGYAFMLTNIVCEFLHPVCLGEKVELCTWPTPPSYVVFCREYELYSRKELCVRSSSRWCMVELATGKVLQSKLVPKQDYSAYRTDRALEVCSWKIPSFELQEGELRFSLTIANSEYDHNMHVNNTRYADYCFNCFTIAELAKKRLKRFSLNFVKQCREGDELRFYRKELSNNSFLIRGVNQTDETVALSEIEFIEK